MKRRNRSKYDFIIPFLYSLGKEDILPTEFRKSIPCTTVFGWRKESNLHYKGSEFRFLLQDSFEAARYKRLNEKLKSRMITLGRAWVILRHVLRAYVRTNRRRKHVRAEMLNVVSILSASFGLRRALKIVGLTPPRFRQWALEASADCFTALQWFALKNIRISFQ